jgi:hypothetical protein
MDEILSGLMAHAESLVGPILQSACHGDGGRTSIIFIDLQTIAQALRKFVSAIA